ncbi:hypothetical protein GCM10020254_62310 [Streptomyces goshikiensis]
MIVVGGEALIDLVPAAAPPGALLPRPGGGPYNTALALGRLGARVAFCSRVSADGFGESLLAGLRAAGVDLSLVQRGPEPTTLAVPSLAPDGSAAYRFYVEGTADRLFTLPPALPAGVRALGLGTCSLVLEPGGQRLRGPAAPGVAARAADPARPEHPAGADRGSGGLPVAVRGLAAVRLGAEVVGGRRGLARRSGPRLAGGGPVGGGAHPRLRGADGVDP